MATKDNTTTLGLLLLLGVAGFMIYRKRKQMLKGGKKLDVSNLQTNTNEDTPVNIDLAKSDAGNEVSNFFNANGSVSYELTKDPDNGTAQINGNVLTYTPNNNFYGADSMKYVKRDDSGQTSNEGTITVTVTAVYDGTSASDINITTAEDTPLTYDLGASSTPSQSGAGLKNTPTNNINTIQQQAEQPTKVGFDGSFTKRNSNIFLDFNGDY